jgi:hypothetical protein
MIMAFMGVTLGHSKCEERDRQEFEGIFGGGSICYRRKKGLGL